MENFNIEAYNYERAETWEKEIRNSGKVIESGTLHLRPVRGHTQIEVVLQKEHRDSPQSKEFKDIKIWDGFTDIIKIPDPLEKALLKESEEGHSVPFIMVHAREKFPGLHAFYSIEGLQLNNHMWTKDQCVRITPKYIPVDGRKICIDKYKQINGWILANGTIVFTVL